MAAITAIMITITSATAFTSAILVIVNTVFSTSQKMSKSNQDLSGFVPDASLQGRIRAPPRCALDLWLQVHDVKSYSFYEVKMRERCARPTDRDAGVGQSTQNAANSETLTSGSDATAESADATLIALLPTLR